MTPRSTATTAAGARDHGARSRRRFRISFFRMFLLVFLVASLGTAAVAGNLIWQAYRGLPILASLEPQPSESTFLYDAQGQLLTQLHGPEHRVLVSLDQIPSHVVNAFVAIEDHRFFDHLGVDFRGILRAAYVNIVGGQIIEGASTITQQLARNAWLTLDRTYERKLQEVFLALQLERFYTKEEILEMYLNQIFFGHKAYGIQAASQVYFGKDVGELTVAEGALLAAVARGPQLYSPYLNPEAAKDRRNLVLEAMVRHGFLNQGEFEQLREQPLVLRGLRRPAEYPHPWFVDYVLSQLLDRYGPAQVYGGGLHVYTTLVPSIQAAAEEAFRLHLDPPFPLDAIDPATGQLAVQPETGGVFLDPHTGYILAMVGGRRHDEALELNRAWQAYRQTGSAFKPLIYAAALEMGYAPATIVDDWPSTYTLVDGTQWTFENHNLLYRGLTPYREGLALSINTMAVKVLEKIGINTGFESARRLGIESLVERDAQDRTDRALSPLALGALTRGTTPLQMARAFAPFANGGYRIEPIAILRVTDRHGNVLEENEPRKEVVLSEESAYLMTSMLRSTVDWGTGVVARLATGHPVAGKTGTTDDDVDAWWVGYTPEFLGAVWMGYDQPRSMDGVWGSTYAAPIWRDVAAAALAGTPPSTFVRPRNIVELDVCIRSGKLPGPHCPPGDIRREVFRRGTEPRTPCDVHYVVMICGDHPNYLAGPGCPNPVARVAIRRTSPWSAYTAVHEDTERLVTFIPADAALEAPTAVCEVHGPPQPGIPYVGPVRNIKLYAWRFQFSPSTITVNFGDKVRIHLESTDVNHGLAIPEFGVHAVVLAGRPVIVEFIAEREGSFPFYSAVFSGRHWDRMTGTLVVLPPAGG
ncbi:MAG TPA: PBP1A family penicillin-binding protein [Bacillota bacterium]|nr:PBP1A family penicillin-binding protein [Bacillota bacterium]